MLRISRRPCRLQWTHRRAQSRCRTVNTIKVCSSPLRYYTAQYAYRYAFHDPPSRAFPSRDARELNTWWRCEFDVSSSLRTSRCVPCAIPVDRAPPMSRWRWTRPGRANVPAAVVVSRSVSANRRGTQSDGESMSQEDGHTSKSPSNRGQDSPCTSRRRR